MARHRGVVLLAWMVALTVSAALYPTLARVLSAPDYSVDKSQSAQVEGMLDGHLFHGVGSEQDALVFYSAGLRASEPPYRAFVERVLAAVRAGVGVEGVTDPYSSYPRRGAVSPGGHAPGSAGGHAPGSAGGHAPGSAGGHAPGSAGGHAPGSAGGHAPASAGGHALVASVGLGGNARARYAHAGQLQEAIARAKSPGVSAWLTGFSPVARDLGQVEKSDGERAEAIGLPIALGILLVALGALVAASVPLSLAGAGLLLTYGVIALLARILRFDAFLLTIVTMIGMGIGIDYSLFVVSRFREELAARPRIARRERRRINAAVGAAVATSGRTVAYSGAIVALSLMSLLVVRAPIFREFVVGTTASVVCTLLAALTLLPAALAALGERINAGALPVRFRPFDAHPHAADPPAADSHTVIRPSPWARWARAMMRRPVRVVAGVCVVLVLAVVPVHGIRYGINLALGSLSRTPSGEAAAVLGRSSSPGMIGPVEVVVRGTVPGARGGGEAAGAASELARELRAIGRRVVARVTVRRSPGGVLLMAVPAVPVDSLAADALVRRLRGAMSARARAGRHVSIAVGGWTAQALDASEETSGKLPLVLAITLGMALVFLLVVFRSMVLPVKAVAMNLLATGAALGLAVFVFQDGHGERLLGFSSPGFIQTFLPLCMFVLLFGLSMDYEVFLIRRMQEAWHVTADNRAAVVSGVEHTARPISAAAAIMVAVFGSFVTAGILELKQFGFALATAIALDATLVRLMLVPALMTLLGKRNWWLPPRLGRLLPRLELD